MKRTRWSSTDSHSSRLVVHRRARRPAREHPAPTALGVAASIIALALTLPGIGRTRADQGSPAPVERPRVLLEPETWRGAPFPLLEHLDTADSLRSGHWTVLLFHHGCPNCEEALRHLAAEPHDGALLAVVELPPYGPRGDDPPGSVRGRLPEDREWVVTTPVVLQLVDGKVIEVIAAPGPDASSNTPRRRVGGTGPTRDIGYVLPGSVHRLEVAIDPAFPERARVLRAVSDCACVRIDSRPAEIVPGGTASVGVTFEAPREAMEYSRTVEILTDCASMPGIRLVLSARVGLPLRIEPGGPLDLGPIAPASSARRTVVVHNDGAEAVKILYATADATGVVAQVPREPLAPGSSIEVPVVVTVPGGSPPGAREASLALRTTHDAQRSLHVRVRYSIEEPPEPEPVASECLALPGWEGIPEDTSIDPVEAQVVLGDWTMPRAGETVGGPAAAPRSWQSVSAGEDGWLSGPALASGYAALEVVRRQDEVLILEAMGHHVVWVNGEPRAGNPYQVRDRWEPWQPTFDYGWVPVRLMPGTNQLLFRVGGAGRLKVLFHRPRAPAVFNSRDATLPDLLADRPLEAWGAVVILNATAEPSPDLTIRSPAGSPVEVASTGVGYLPPLGIRKAPFRLQAPASGPREALELELVRDGAPGAPLDAVRLPLATRSAGEVYRATYLSSVDGSVQYYAVRPAAPRPGRMDAVGANPGLCLALHGAAVLAENHAKAYSPKAWLHVVAPTNRRPYGFDWEDWGRLDALDVLEVASRELATDPRRVYLTGHSMGGHGTWHVASLHPDRFAAIGPSAGWVAFETYRARPSEENPSTPEALIRRLRRARDPRAVAANLRQLGVYVLHGKEDESVPIEQSRIMTGALRALGKDVVLDEQDGAGHWWDKLEEEGADCVDWHGMFDVFARHVRPDPASVREVSFVTLNPGASSSNLWLSILAQERMLLPSSATVRWDPGRRKFSGDTENVRWIALGPASAGADRAAAVALDGQSVAVAPEAAPGERIFLERAAGVWREADSPSPELKGPHRYGTFKDAFRNRPVLVHGTRGSEAENRWALARARLDSETFWYQGNGSFEILPDTLFRADEDPSRNVVLYGNADTNSAWSALLGDSPVQVARGAARVGDREIAGAAVGAFLIRPRPGSDLTSVAAVSGTGVPGMRLTDRRPYLRSGYDYPDWTLFGIEEGSRGGPVLIGAGFFGLDWSLERGETSGTLRSAREDASTARRTRSGIRAP